MKTFLLQNEINDALIRLKYTKKAHPNTIRRFKITHPNTFQFLETFTNRPNTRGCNVLLI